MQKRPRKRERPPRRAQASHIREARGREYETQVTGFNHDASGGFEDPTVARSAQRLRDLTGANLTSGNLVTVLKHPRVRVRAASGSSRLNVRISASRLRVESSSRPRRISCGLMALVFGTSLRHRRWALFGAPSATNRQVVRSILKVDRPRLSFGEDQQSCAIISMAFFTPHHRTRG